MASSMGGSRRCALISFLCVLAVALVAPSASAFYGASLTLGGLGERSFGAAALAIPLARDGRYGLAVRVVGDGWDSARPGISGCVAPVEAIAHAVEATLLYRVADSLMVGAGLHRLRIDWFGHDPDSEGQCRIDQAIYARPVATLLSNTDVGPLSIGAELRWSPDIGPDATVAIGVPLYGARLAVGYRHSSFDELYRGVVVGVVAKF